MTRSGTHRLLLAIAVLHLAADAAFAGGSVLCVGTNGHRAIESEHVAARCPSAPEAVAHASGTQRLDPVSEDCKDETLHSASGEIASQPIDGSDVGGRPVLLSGPMARALGATTPPLRVAPSQDLRPPDIPVLRTTVLLI